VREASRRRLRDRVGRADDAAEDDVAVEDETEAKKILRLIDQLEENDDVQEVYANFDIPERVLESVAG
jgi:transcriptional/translational regulatory protein YebC/TACO1